MGNSCSMSKAGLLLTVGLSLNIDVSEQGVAEEHSELWLSWVGTAIADAVAQLASIPSGNVETTVTCADPRAADMAAFGGGVGVSFPCDAKVRAMLLFALPWESGGSVARRPRPCLCPPLSHVFACLVSQRRRRSPTSFSPEICRLPAPQRSLGSPKYRPAYTPRA